VTAADGGLAFFFLFDEEANVYPDPELRVIVACSLPLVFVVIPVKVMLPDDWPATVLRPSLGVLLLGILRWRRKRPA
jgi:hypothetical protein